MDDEFHHIIYKAVEKNKIWYAMKRVSSHYDRARYLEAIMNETDLNKINQAAGIANYIVVFIMYQ